jgi:hypothetical protein
MSVFKAVYFRHHTTQSEDFDTLQDALEFLEQGSDRNELSRLCVLWDGKISWVASFYGEAVAREECINKGYLKDCNEK